MRDYASFYKNLTSSIRQSPLALSLLATFNRSVTKLMYLLYPLLLGYISLNSPNQLLIYILVPGLTFLLVTIIRKVINQARPYEKWSIQPIMTKDTVGQSMPSRHVFSATMISMCFLSFNICLGLVLLILSATLAICRVLGGVHYPKDVIAGMLIGILAGLVLIIS
ncbi:membrane-associated phospholipid phosphatase [Streptococcus varani]|uniref:Membrane-associated phospholipid phosphatase n=1 Tax=Streptococcus varani TaxID=1608583 RepID=A0A0E4CSS1_9STRE|nr:phosphatase PAP2 family protein [Streptococcus varani]CQR24873.1 membrane-associated phospholipid phosphatase [Streptococcus varani]